MPSLSPKSYSRRSSSHADSDKHLLRRDVKRLFNEHGEEDKWNPAINVRYKSYQQARHHAERDGTAFASIVMPAYYSAVYSVSIGAQEQAVLSGDYSTRTFAG